MNSRTSQNKSTDLLSFACPEEKIAYLIGAAKDDFDQFFISLKKCLIEFLFSSEREMLAGPKYDPLPGWEKWGSQAGSVYVGGEKLKVKKPRLRKDKKEVQLSVYQELNNKDRFSDDLLEKALKGISCREYEGALDGLLDHFGISKSSVSRHLKAATSKQLKELKDRDLSSFSPFAILIDGYHLAGKVFIVAMAIDLEGNKHSLGFWEGATENNVICQELLNNLDRRGLKLDEKILFITDGGKRIIKALKDRFGKLLIHQRCTIHKDRNIQKHLPKKYRKEAHHRFRNAINCLEYEDAKNELKKLESWLETINPSAAESLRECFEELLTVHCLKVPPRLRKTLHSTNPIESVFSNTSRRMGRITRIQTKGKMAQRWLGTTLLDAEKRFRKVKGYFSIEEVRERIIRIQSEIKTKVA